MSEKCQCQTLRNILIENSTFYSTCNAFKLGTDTQGDYRNIIARKLVLGGLPDASQSFRNRDDCSTGITLATVDGGNIENILIQDIEINRSRCPIFLRIGNRGRRLNEKMEHPGYLKNVVIKNIKGTDNRLQGSLISGIKEYPVENVVIRNMDIETVGGGTQKMATLEVPELEGGYPDAQDFRRNGLPAFGFMCAMHRISISKHPHYAEEGRGTSFVPCGQRCRESLGGQQGDGGCEIYFQESHSWR